MWALFYFSIRIMASTSTEFLRINRRRIPKKGGRFLSASLIGFSGSIWPGGIGGEFFEKNTWREVDEVEPY